MQLHLVKSQLNTLQVCEEGGQYILVEQRS